MIFLCVFLSVAVFVFYVKWCQNYWKRKKVPTLKHDFFFGHDKQIITNKISHGVSFLNKYREMKKLYPSAKHSGFYFFLRPIYTPLDPALLKQIMLKDFSYFMSHGVYHDEKDILSMNLFTLDGDRWKTLRAKMTPTFTSSKMRFMFDTFQQKTNGLVKLVESFDPDKKPLNIKEVLQRFTIDIIGSCAFGVECNSLEDPNSDFAKYGKKVSESNQLRFLLKEVMSWKLLASLGFRDFGRQTCHFFIDLVKETMKYRESTKNRRNDFMDLLLKLKSEANMKNQLSEKDILAQCFVFFLAGFETSATTMTFALLLLSQHQDIQDKLRREIQEVLEKHDGQMSYEAIMEMQYLERVINETLRMYPPVPGIPRICTKNYPVPGTDVIIDKGTMVNIPVWGIHMDPEYYPNPEMFDPDRFTDINVASRPDFTFLPFGEGPRMCIGLRFGMLQSKSGLASLIRNFKFTLNKKTSLPIKMEPGNVILVSKGSVWLDVHPIKTN